jgi:hypothetical protein
MSQLGQRRKYSLRADVFRSSHPIADEVGTKVERGEVRSRRGYAAFRAALGRGRQDDDGG